jgi:hypothetical protein
MRGNVLSNKGRNPSPCPSPYGRGNAVAAVQPVGQAANFCLERSIEGPFSEFLLFLSQIDFMHRGERCWERFIFSKRLLEICCSVSLIIELRINLIEIKSKSVKLLANIIELLVNFGKTEIEIPAMSEPKSNGGENNGLFQRVLEHCYFSPLTRVEIQELGRNGNNPLQFQA